MIVHTTLQFLISNGLFLHILASPERLNQIASDMDLKKFDNNEVLRKFEANEHEQFPPLTLSEKHKCVLYAMEMVHFDQEDSTLPGNFSPHKYEIHLAIQFFLSKKVILRSIS